MPGRLKDARLRLHVACEPGWRDAVVAAAAAEGESLSAYVRTAVDARLSGRAAAEGRRARGAGRGEPATARRRAQSQPSCDARQHRPAESAGGAQPPRQGASRVAGERDRVG